MHTIEFSEIVKTIIMAILGGSGLVGILFYFIRIYIDKQFQSRILLNDYEIRRKQIRSELDECYRQCFFWIRFYITTGETGDNLEQAFQKLYVAEEKKKALENEILARTGGK